VSEHLDDLLSAYADGQLGQADEARADQHLQVCAACRAELAATQQVKAWVTALPEVLAPFGFYERMLLDGRGPRERRNRWAVRVGAISLAATASIWLGVVGLGSLGGPGGGMPALNSLVSAHLGAPVTTERAPAMASIRAEASSLGLPEQMPGSYELVSLTEDDGQHQAVYSDGEQRISVFVVPGFLDVRRLPAGTQPQQIGGETVWILPSQPALAVAQRGDTVVAVVGPAPASLTEEVDPPSTDPSLTERVVAAGDGLLDAFGFG
jgi:hypothetical protein